MQPLPNLPFVNDIALLDNLPAAASYTKGGRAIPAAPEKNRMIFKNGNHPRFYLTYRKNLTNCDWEKWIAIAPPAADKSPLLYLKKKETCQRLHLGKRELDTYQASQILSLKEKNNDAYRAQAQTLFSLLNSHLSRQSTFLMPALDLFAAMVPHYQSSETSHFQKNIALFDSKGNFKIRLKVLMALVKKACSHPLSLEQANFFTLDERQVLKGHVQLRESEPLKTRQILQFLSREKRYLIDLTDAKHIDKGSTNWAYRVFNLSLAKPAVLKTCAPLDLTLKGDAAAVQQAAAKVAYEARLLQQTHRQLAQQQLKENQIQEEYLGTVALQEPFIVGSIGKSYESNLLEIIHNPPRYIYGMQEYLSAFYQLLQGLSNLHQAAVIHGDLRPDNILWKRKKNDRLAFVIADFNQALLTNDLMADGQKVRASLENFSANRYHQPQDIAAMQQASISSDREKVKELYQKRDVYALAIIFIDMLCNQENLPPLELLKQELIDTGTDPALIAIFSQMLAPNFQQRVDSQQAYSLFKDYLQQSHRPLLKAILKEEDAHTTPSEQL